MSEFISQLTSAVSSDEEVLILQQLISSLSVKHNAGGSDTTLTGLVDKGGTFDLFGKNKTGHIFNSSGDSYFLFYR
jgi:hypothetical protein